MCTPEYNDIALLFAFDEDDTPVLQGVFKNNWHMAITFARARALDFGRPTAIVMVPVDQPFPRGRRDLKWAKMTWYGTDYFESWSVGEHASDRDGGEK